MERCVYFVIVGADSTDVVQSRISVYFVVCVGFIAFCWMCEFSLYSGGQRRTTGYIVAQREPAGDNGTQRETTGDNDTPGDTTRYNG